MNIKNTLDDLDPLDRQSVEADLAIKNFNLNKVDMSDEYLEQMQAHLDMGGKLNHKNAVELLAELNRCRT